MLCAWVFSFPKSLSLNKHCLLIVRVICPGDSAFGRQRGAGLWPFVKGCVLSPQRPRTKPGDNQQIWKEYRKPGSRTKG